MLVDIDHFSASAYVVCGGWQTGEGLQGISFPGGGGLWIFHMVEAWQKNVYSHIDFPPL